MDISTISISAASKGKNGIVQIDSNRDEEMRTEAQSVNEEDTGTDKQPRLSFYYESTSRRPNSNRERVLDEIDKVEQLITLNLQKINDNLMSSNSILSNKLISSLETLNKNSYKIYNNVSHIKEFFENAANVNILTKKDIELQVNDLVNSIDKDDAETGSSDVFDVDNNASSELSEFRDIKSRYRDNLELYNDKEVTITNTNIANKKSLNDATAFSNEGGNDSVSFLSDFRVNMDDESTGRQPVDLMFRGNTQGGDLNLNTSESIRISQYITEVKGEEEKREEEEEEEKEERKEEEGLKDKYFRDIITGYESPPWEEPPMLESYKFATPKSAKRKRRRSSAEEVSLVNQEWTDENIEEVVEDVSIRFPSSPKYGAGGKLLRTEKGRQIALDFARSEMMKSHPILSLQPGNLESAKTLHNNHMKNSNKELDPFDSMIDTIDSTLDEPPVLISESLGRKQSNADS